MVASNKIWSDCKYAGWSGHFFSTYALKTPFFPLSKFGPFLFSGTCKTVPEAEAASSSGSLDIVFIVSQHSSMATDLEPWEYMFELLSLDMELPFDEVRVGVVGFAGLQELHAPYVLKQDDR